MWLSQKSKEKLTGEAAAQVGAVTLEGEQMGVYLAGEWRNLPVFGPGGYCWRPSLEQEVLVLKTGTAGESMCIIGEPCTEQIKPGEVQISSGGGASITLTPDGTVNIQGQKVTVNGVPLVAESAQTGGEA